MSEGWAKDARIASGGVTRARRLRRAMTYTERLLWEQVRKLGLNVRRQVPIGPFVADFVCHPAKLIIEIDGGIHRLDEVQLRDAEREAWLKAEHFRVLRFSSKDITDNLFAVTAQIEAAIRSPFPLEGGRVGDGGARAGDGAKSPVGADLRPSRASLHSPPTQPFPPRGGRA